MKISELPEWAREAFAVNKVEELNRVQSALCDAALFTNNNLLLCAPTGPFHVWFAPHRVLDYTIHRLLCVCVCFSLSQVPARPTLPS